MRGGIRRRAGQLVLITVAAPLVAWALERGARRAEARDASSAASRWLRQGADLAQRFGRGPLAERLRAQAAATDPATRRTGRHGG